MFVYDYHFKHMEFPSLQFMEIGEAGAVMDLVQNPVRAAPKLEVVPVITQPLPTEEITAPVHQQAARLATHITARVSASNSLF